MERKEEIMSLGYLLLLRSFHARCEYRFHNPVAWHERMDAIDSLINEKIKQMDQLTHTV
jgi:hypothetical protein